ncbi:putative signal peptide-containing and transmembrane domain-containing protein, partial [Cryptosporidium canis]
RFEEDVRQDKFVTDRCVESPRRLRCYWGLLESELIHILKAEHDGDYGIFGFNNDTAAVVFLRKLMDLTSNFKASRKEDKWGVFGNHSYSGISLANNRHIKWYNYYDAEDVDRLVERLELGEVSPKSIMRESGQVEKLAIKLVILSVFYEQYCVDKLLYTKLVKEGGSLSKFTRHLFEEFDKEMAVLEKETRQLLSELEEGAGGGWRGVGIGPYVEGLFQQLLGDIGLEISTYTGMASRTFDRIRKRLYSRILHYYIWVIVLAKLFFILSRKLVSMVFLLDSLLIYLMDNAEDYLFMIISLQFTSEMVFSVLQEAIV